MSYPEKSATYKNQPAWLDRAVDGEREKATPYRADGGPAFETEVCPAVSGDMRKMRAGMPDQAYRDVEAKSLQEKGD